MPRCSLCVCVGVRACVCSGELQKPVPGQPSVQQVLNVVLKECKKENLPYKMAALRSTATVLEATGEDRFQEVTDILFPLIRKVQNILKSVFVMVEQDFILYCIYFVF